MDEKTALIKLDEVLKEWTASEMGRRNFMVALPLLLASCAAPPKTRYREGDNTGQEIQKTKKK